MIDQIFNDPIASNTIAKENRVLNSGVECLLRMQKVADSISAESTSLFFFRRGLLLWKVLETGVDFEFGGISEVTTVTQ